MPPPEPRLSTRRVGVFVTLLNKEASMERTAPANLSGVAGGGGGARFGVLAWFRTRTLSGFACRRTRAELWEERESGNKSPGAEAACSSCKGKINLIQSAVATLTTRLFPALRPLIIHLNRRLAMCFWINNWKGGQLINKTNWVIYYLRGSPFII